MKNNYCTYSGAYAGDYGVQNPLKCQNFFLKIHHVFLKLPHTTGIFRKKKTLQKFFSAFASVLIQKLPTVGDNWNLLKFLLKLCYSNGKKNFNWNGENKIFNFEKLINFQYFLSGKVMLKLQFSVWFAICLFDVSKTLD